MRYISSQTAHSIRFVGLSTAVANAVDLADWLAINPQVWDDLFGPYSNCIHCCNHATAAIMPLADVSVHLGNVV